MKSTRETLDKSEVNKNIPFPVRRLSERHASSVLAIPNRRNGGDTESQITVVTDEKSKSVELCDSDDLESYHGS
jgi:hypothetical protein